MGVGMVVRTSIAGFIVGEDSKQEKNTTRSRPSRFMKGMAVSLLFLPFLLFLPAIRLRAERAE